MKTQISFIQRVHHTKNNKDVWINLFNMTDKIKYAGQDEYIVRNYLVNVWVNLFNMTDKIKYAGQDEYIVRNYLVNVMKLKINKN